ncbi:ATP-binding protein [Robertmurraya kyonggiensis]|uniref:histidine kinase n=1 Tax=Robertmurraya kyonggiensis TaxID=1037680 RepID=A0A4V6WND7_9BACI|nr:ATP-binding protein [Robertmurraya kyonggiensis]TKC18460.1 two-component sensor histidine kinase [Robertmurraya kyonggiensis]
MKRKHKKTIILYIFIVLLPTILGSYYLIHIQSQRKLDERMEEANWVAHIHASHWDKFISDTVTSLEVLSLAAKTLYTDLEDMQPLLERTNQSDPRYGGIYILSIDGQIITGSNKIFQKNAFFEIDIVQEVVRTKDIIISNKEFSLPNDQKVLALAVPILNDKNELIAVSMSLLRVDYVKNLLNVLTPGAQLLVLNANDEEVMGFNIKKDDPLDNDRWVSVPIDRIPWNLQVKVPEPDVRNTTMDYIFIIGAVLILTNILFLLIMYMLLRRQAALEKQENEVQKLELVGTLAASTAHEIRNPLTGIKGLVQLLGEKYDDPTDRLYFSVINKEIERINEIVGEFLILGKPTAQKMHAVDIAKVLNELQPLILSEATLNKIDLIYNPSEQPIFVKCTRDQMKQVILNITRNAFEAMENGGRLTIDLSKKNSTCELMISDTGVGIKDEVIEKIFTPFYTSKETGTGLGLVVCRRILHSFGGKIHITSKENKGTTVKITLPIAKTH